MNTKNNQRFRETEVRMEAAVLELMKHTDFEKITVKKICETARVNRSTFYAHFVDIYDMLDKMEMHLHQELLDHYPAHSAPEEMMFSEPLLISFLQHIRKHQYFYRIVLKTRTEFPLKRSFEGMWNQVILPRCTRAGITSEEEMMYCFVHLQAGFTMLLKRWVDAGCRESEAELAGIIRKCTPSLWGISQAPTPASGSV